MPNPIAAWSFERKIVAIVAAVAILAALGSLITWDIDDYPAWLEAIATAAALAAAVFAARYAFAAFKLEAAREERWMAQQRSSQAELIAAWPGSFNWSDGGNDPYSGEPSRGRGLDSVMIRVQNASAVPITNVWIDATIVIARPEGPHRVDFGTRLIDRVLPPVAKPEGRWFEATTAVDPAEYVAPGVEPDYWCELTISFRDAGGRDWQRIPDGQLLLVQDANAHD